MRKILKENWNWSKNRLFCYIFVVGEISIGGAPPPSLLATPMPNGVRQFIPGVREAVQSNSEDQVPREEQTRVSVS